MIFVDGVDIGDVADVALRDRRMLSRRRHLHHRRDGLRAGRLVRRRRPRCSRAACRSSTATRAFIDELREAVEDSLDRAAEQQITEIDVLESILHDDLASFIYDRLKRRPMVLPVVVEV